MATATCPTPDEPLLTAEEFARRPDPGHAEELVRGRVIRMPPPGFRHGEVCAQVVFLLKLHLMAHDLGRVVSNDSGVVTERGPDSVRGPDVAFYRYDRLGRDATPRGYPDVAPDMVFEVLSPDDRWPKALAKVAEYLGAGVVAVALLDPERRTLHLFEAEAPVRILSGADELALPVILGPFRVAVDQFFC
ncbi:MAG: Uma2 family endonuclease [Isosphaeraceae bacterium]